MKTKSLRFGRKTLLLQNNSNIGITYFTSTLALLTVKSCIKFILQADEEYV